MRAVFDIEADNLLEGITKIHCLCYTDVDTNLSGSFTAYEDITKFVMQNDLTLIGHNCVRYDLPALNKILGIECKAKLVDTLPLSWTLFPQHFEHGLEAWGERLGIPKPPISDWRGLTDDEQLIIDYYEELNRDGI